MRAASCAHNTQQHSYNMPYILYHLRHIREHRGHLQHLVDVLLNLVSPVQHLKQSDGGPCEGYELQCAQHNSSRELYYLVPIARDLEPFPFLCQSYIRHVREPHLTDRL